MKKSIAIALACLSISANAEFMDGNKLLARLQSQNGDYLGGIGYIMGVADYMHGVSYCPAPTVTSGQIADMVKIHLESLPEVRHHAADRHISYVLKKAWPCAESKRSPGV